MPELERHIDPSVFANRGVNETGGTLAAGTLVRFSGFSTTVLLPKIVKADADVEGARCMGVLREPLVNGAMGIIYKSFDWTNQDTSSVTTVGDAVYLSDTAGGWSATAGTNSQAVGWCSVKSATVGAIHFAIDAFPVAVATFDVTDGSIATADLAAGAVTLAKTGTNIWTPGATVAAANNLVLGADGDTFHISGATQINLLASTNFRSGSRVRLIFDSTPTVKHAQTTSGANKRINLTGATDIVAVALESIELVYDGTVWTQVGLGGSTSGSGAVVRVTSATLVTPALGTPSALVGTNITGTGASFTAGTVTTNANLTGAVTSVGNATTITAPKIGVLSETHLASTFTDGGAAVGTKAMTGTIPAGAILIGTRVLVAAGFAGDVSAVLIIGDGSDTDRYNTGTPSVFATAATGVEVGECSGARLQIAAVSPVLTVTSNADFTPVLSGGGSVTVAISYVIPS